MLKKIIYGQFIFLLVFIAWFAHAGIYKWTDENGRVHFSDQKPEAQKFEDIEDQIKSGGNTYSGSVASKQKALVAEIADTILPGDPDKTDLYFMSFAGDAKQDVFMKEALFTQRLFDQQYDTRQRSAALINNRTTTSQHLVASNENLERMLKIMGRKMNKGDVLYLYLTSHGSKDHKLSIDFPPHTVRDFGAHELRRMLDESGIKWRVIVVSACYSGGFVEPLKTDYSVIATASDAFNTSFGCSNERNFTYYGEAIFDRQMRLGVDMIEALDGARDIVSKMEKSQGLVHSNPQFWVGAKMGLKMDRLLALN